MTAVKPVLDTYLELNIVLGLSALIWLLARATLTKKHKAGDFEGASTEFARWNKAGGRVLKGLVRRRAAEARLYVS